MNRKALGLASFFVGAALVGCGGGGPQYVDASHPTDATPEVAPTVDAGTDSLPPPAPAPTSKLIAPAGSTLVGSGADSCTNQDPAPGDRWCAFTRPGTTLGYNDLWVINVTKAAAVATTPGAPAIKCDTSDPNCIRLSTALYEDLDFGFSSNGFVGDTLVYYEEPTHNDAAFVGVVRAWRPGWAGGRKLTGDSGFVCAGHKTSNAILCLENSAASADKTVFTVDLHAGNLTDQAGGLLPKVDTILTSAATDPDGLSKWRVDISPDGASVAWSSRADAAGPEVLRVQKMGDDASRKVVAEDVSQWIMSTDGAAWLWLKKYNYNLAGAPSGTLESAPFPSGTSPKMLATDVGEYDNSGTKGLLIRQKLKSSIGDLVLMPDRDAPETVSLLDQNVRFVFDQTKDGSKVVYTKVVKTLTVGLASAPIYDLYAVSNDGKRPCPMAATSIAILAPDLLESGVGAAWGRYNSTTMEFEGVYTDIPSCTTKKFANEVYSWSPIGSEGFVYLDELWLDPDIQLDEATLRYGKVSNGALPAPGTTIQTRSQFTYAPLLPTLPAVVYEVKSGAGNDGLYINASLPFTTKPVVPPPDGGAPDVVVTPDTGTDSTVPPVDASDASSAVDAADAPAAETGTDVALDADPDAG